MVPEKRKKGCLLRAISVLEKEQSTALASPRSSGLPGAQEAKKSRQTWCPGIKGSFWALPPGRIFQEGERMLGSRSGEASLFFIKVTPLGMMAPHC